MIKVDASLLYWMVMLLEQMKVSCRLQADIQTVKEAHQEEFLRHLEVARSYAEKLSLPLTHKQVDRLAKNIWESTCSYEGILAGLTELTTRLCDELVLYHIPSENRDFLECARTQIDDKVYERFPETRFDLEEGRKCLTLGCGTACIFHLSRAIEVGLRYIAREAQKHGIACPDPEATQSWDHWLQPIEINLGKNRKRKQDGWNAVEQNYATTVNLLRMVSSAWRHPTLRGADKYTVEEARDVFDSTYEFMRYLATAKFS
ncbi:MAG: hypothetical protein A4E19_03790 [Nitrospira sp. SG-bin1]|nr:MAG: hypothetical protein A4E19_03790 [Nitrospira sp. SG-bin1]